MLRRLLLLTSLFLFAIVATQAQTVLTADQLQNGQAVELDKLDWKYAPGDDPRFAEPQFDDRVWETLKGTAITLDSIPKSGWHGIGWFRLRLKADPALANPPLALLMTHYGASEVYLDGRLVERFGTVGATPETEVEYNPQGRPIAISLPALGEHVLAVRRSHSLSQTKPALLRRFFAEAAQESISLGEIGFFLRVGELNTTVASREVIQRRLAIGSTLSTTLLGLIGLLHLLLFYYYPPQRANFWFGLFALSDAAFIYSRQIRILGTQGVAATITFMDGSYVAVASINVCLLAYLYTQFEGRLLRRFRYLVLLQLLILLLLIAPSPAGFARWVYMFGALLIYPLEWLRVLFRAVLRKEAGALSITIAVLLFCLNPFVDFLQLLGAASFTGFARVRGLTILTLSLTISIFLARNFARANRNLEQQLEQVKRLSLKEVEHEREQAEIRVQREQERARLAEVEAENDRRAAELEEARQLQLSMLPKKLPSLPQLDIAAYMKTASEVGGDYYDFHLTEDGTLTVAVGDATGHGLRAGTMVASVKSLFVTLAYHPDIPHIFTRLSQTLKQMNLRGLF
ncbi:MAG TPA: hypothetical protein VFZ34_20355, partial [Blastocatellia bacterium]|nr:hypothetical protein [Blastocatellia bacterium]